MTSWQETKNIIDPHLLAAINVGATCAGSVEPEAFKEAWSRGRTGEGIDPEDFWFIKLFQLKRAREWRPKVFTGSDLATEHDPEDVSPHELERPFDKLYDLLSDDDKTIKIISHIRSQLNRTFAPQLAERLTFLADVAKEEVPQEAAIEPQSLSHFVGFLQSVPNLRCPTVVLSPEKNIRAQWRAGPNRHFVVEFLSTGDARFVIFSPDANQPEKTIRLSGSTSIDSLLETTEPHGVLSWSTL